jgi:hypothetical protein
MFAGMKSVGETLLGKAGAIGRDRMVAPEGR